MMMPRTGLYAITQTEHKSNAQVIAAVAAAIKGGAVMIQYRNKSSNNNAHGLASQLLDICHLHETPLIINDDIDLALRLSADGVHLGKDDVDIDQAHACLGDTAIIGISCYNSLERAAAAEKLGADYVAFGRYFASTSKPLAEPADIATLTAAKNSLHVPIVAIGGILPENGASLLAAGADLLAVIGGVFDHDDPECAARRYQPLFTV